MDDKQEKSLPFSPSQLLSVDEELWKMAEERAQEILWTIEPNVLSEVNRKDVIDCVQRLIRDNCGAKLQVLPFGSVPLKTYLPDGDIDLTALSQEDEEDDLAQAVCNILESDEDPKYQIQDVQHIPAQVQLVKCAVKNIPVDISFNQKAGLHTLYFLEQVDQLVGKNHLFKRSVILIKAWCYYESRLLGGHYGLLSTYAIEILVLYIINRSHSSLRGPLEVLYIFLNYYGSFDWDHNYLSIWGPKALSSLPKIADTPESNQGEFLLQKELLRTYKNMCYTKEKASETMTHEFSVKFMNILDPLQNDNNLGRTVSMANLHRIRFALSYGAGKLKQIFELPGENMGAALEKFFSCSLNRNGKGERADVNVPVPPFGTGRSEECVRRGDCDNYYDNSQYVQQYPNYAMPGTTVPSSSSSLTPQEDTLALSTQKNWSRGDILALSTPQNWSEGDILALQTQQNWSEDDFLALQTQQDWCVFYQSGSNLYTYGKTLFHPTYSLEEGGRSRGTGTYIPDLNYNAYWDISPKANYPRGFPSAEHYALPKLFPTKEEIHSEKDMSGITKPFELSNEEFPVLPGIRAAPPTQARESAPLAKFLSETDKNGNSGLSELSKEDFNLLPSVPKATLPTQVHESAPLAKVLSETNRDDNSGLSELSKQEFLLIPSIHKATRPTQAQESAPLANVLSETDKGGSSSLSKLSNEDFLLLPSVCKATPPTQTQDYAAPSTKVLSKTDMDGNLRSFELSNKDFPLLPKVNSETHMDGNSKSFELSKVDFPLLQHTHKTVLSESAELTKQAKSSPFSKVSKQKDIEIGTHKNSQSLTEQSLSTNGDKEDSDVSLSQETVPVVSKVAMDRKEESPESNENKD